MKSPIQEERVVDPLIIADRGRRRMMLVVVCFGAFMANMDASIVNVCLPTIASEWDLSPSSVSLIVLAYLLFETGPILAFGKLGDQIGPRRVFLGGFALFTLSSLACGLSVTLWQLVLLRAAQGIGGAMIFSVMLSFAAFYIAPEERGRAMGTITMAAALGVAVGPTVGGFIADLAGWRHIFFINVPLGIAAVLVGMKSLPTQHPAPRDRRFDLPGAVLQTLILGLFLFAINQERELGWTSPWIASSLAASILLGALFVRRELRIPYPLLDFSLLSNRDTLLATASFCLSMMVMGGVLFIMPFYLQDIRGIEVAVIGLVMSVISLGQFFGPFAGHLGDRFGHRRVALGGVVVGVVSFGFFVTMDLAAPMGWVVAGLVLFGISQGLNRAPNIQLIMASVPAEHKSVAASITSVMRSLGLVLGVVLFETLFSQFIPPSVSLDDVSLSRSGIEPEVLHRGFEVTLMAGLLVSLLMVVLIALVGRQRPAHVKPVAAN